MSLKDILVDGFGTPQTQIDVLSRHYKHTNTPSDDWHVSLKIVLCHHNVCKPTTAVDLHLSFSDTKRLPRTHMLVVNAYKHPKSSPSTLGLTPNLLSTCKFRTPPRLSTSIAIPSNLPPKIPVKSNVVVFMQSPSSFRVKESNENNVHPDHIMKYLYLDSELQSCALCRSQYEKKTPSCMSIRIWRESIAMSMIYTCDFSSSRFLSDQNY